MLGQGFTGSIDAESSGPTPVGQLAAKAAGLTMSGGGPRDGTPEKPKSILKTTASSIKKRVTFSDQ
jgi:hypothetical protein